MNSMHFSVNISNALQQIESVKTAVDQSDDAKLKAATNDDLNMLINLLESPILRSIVTLHDSVSMLATQVAHHPSIIPADFDITPAGELAIQSRNLYGSHEGEEEQTVPQVSPPQSLEFGSNSDNERILGLDSASVDSNMSPKQTRGLLEMGRNDDSIASTSNNIVAGDWAQVEIINLVNDGTGLGFGIIGARTSGVIVKTILAGGVADRDGRLKSGDHILQIGDVSLMEMGSEQVAGVLRASGSRVRLVVARAVDPTAVHASNAPIVPARLLSSPEALDRYLMEAGFEQVFHTQPTPLSNNSNSSRFVFDKSITPPLESDAESPEADRFTVQLKKDENGLGITIAGYVCEKEELSGIFVKSVTPGSAAALSGKVRVNDRIVAVDGVSLAGKSNQRAVDALKQSGNIVTLELERYLRGPKFEQLQQAIAAGESAASAPVAQNNPFLHMHRADNSDSSDHHIQMTHLNTVENNADELSESGRSSASTIHRPQPAFEMPRTQEQKDAIKRKWQAILGEDVEIVVGVVVRGGGGLGISLEGTVDVEGGREVRPHHYVRSVLPEGPVGRANVHRPGDELLGTRTYTHTDIHTHHYVRSVLPEGPVGRANVHRPGDELLGTRTYTHTDIHTHHYVRSVLPEGPVGRANVHRPGDELLGTRTYTHTDIHTHHYVRSVLPEGPVGRANVHRPGDELLGTRTYTHTDIHTHHYVRSVLPEGPVGRANVHRPGDELLGTRTYTHTDIHTHHYVRSVLPEGPVGRANVHRPGDELLGTRTYTHTDIHTHHYVRSVLPEGPVGRANVHRPGDELLGTRTYTHTDIHTHHYVRSVLPEGPVGRANVHRPGDELLGTRTYTHTDIHTHHYVRSVLPEGPVGRANVHRPGDELLGTRTYTHTDIHTHHYVRSVLPEGPVGRANVHRPGDELLGTRTYTHTDIHTHHYVRSVLPEGPVGRANVHRPGDELLGTRTYTHTDIHTHHYVRSVLPEGPVGRANVHRPGDELLGTRTYTHTDIHTHHYVRSVLPEGPVGRANVHRPGDELLGTRTYTHTDIHTHHYVRSVLPEGPVGRANVHRPGDELLGTRTYTHTDIHTHHYVRSVLPEGPVGRANVHRPGDELLGTRTYTHTDIHTHHYVRSVLPEGPVGRANVHRPGDELLEVNGHRLLGMNHLEVVSILKELSSEVCMVCARPRPAPQLDLAPPAHTLVKAKSDGSLAGAGAGGGEEGGALGAAGKVRSRSLEPLTGLAMWASEPQIIELVKGERGLGFSILDYQDPLRPAHTLVVIRSLVPGGVAQQDGRLIPGDRLLFVNEQNLENASLEQAVAALKGAPRGIVRIGVAKPLPLADHPPPPPTTPPPTS
ncbi:patj homolog isoform X2 [Colias croceus]|uniref:patj homolog isoform X2 n=1 Tax=Colias crocea TaxID=72248 RepID=UPI001E27CDEB|nr:patj homolog isoform X2 [Colias croceus]